MAKFNFNFKAAAESAVISAATSAATSAVTLCATFLFLFLALPFAAHAQNYPLLTPGGLSAEEENFELEREAERNRINTITMYWEIFPNSFPQTSLSRITTLQTKPGEQTTLALRARNWFSQTPGSAFFMPPVPQGVILTPLAVSDEERQSGIALKIKIIPLEAGEIVFPARTLKFENTQFTIPSLRLQSLHRRN